ncbi:MAG TPA: hypothetical protein VGO63_00940 [Candidatus Paceibacterota bacterium]|jgi:hypothetical protein|nr:hypothetical protein [Candidatus Paceibacterota bacterium]
MDTLRKSLKFEKESRERALRMTKKIIWLILRPIIIALIVCLFWRIVVFGRIHFDNGVKDIAMTAGILFVVSLYVLLTAVVINAVLGEHKSNQMPNKSDDTLTFIKRRDEELGPIIHVLMAVVTLAVLATFMFLPYPTAGSGLVFVGSTAFLLSLIFFVLKDIWYIACQKQKGGIENS